MNKKLIAYVVIDILLLIGCLVLVSKWFDLSKTLRDPCGACAWDNPKIKECLYRPIPVKIDLKKINIEDSSFS
jgi:hypothetical protein